jgi:predicted nucleotidyltransferase
MKINETSPTVAEVTQTVRPILERYGATRAGLFGSLVRGRLRRSSDIDILVELSPTISLLDVVGIQQDLEDALGRRVDLVEYAAIKPLLKERILAQEIRIL